MFWRDLGAPNFCNVQPMPECVQCSSLTKFDEISTLKAFDVKFLHMYVIDRFDKLASLMLKLVNLEQLSMIFLMCLKYKFTLLIQRTFRLF